MGNRTRPCSWAVRSDGDWDVETSLVKSRQNVDSRRRVGKGNLEDATSSCAKTLPAGPLNACELVDWPAEHLLPLLLSSSDCAASPLLLSTNSRYSDPLLAPSKYLPTELPGGRVEGPLPKTVRSIAWRLHEAHAIATRTPPQRPHCVTKRKQSLFPLSVSDLKVHTVGSIRADWYF